MRTRITLIGYGADIDNIGSFLDMGRNIYYPNIFGHILNRKNQTFIKFGKILKENFI
jgi:hypothetical protein